MFTGIQAYSNEGHRPTQQGYSWEIIKINCQLLKIFFSRTTGQISIKLGAEHPWVKGHALLKGYMIDNCEIE